MALKIRAIRVICVTFFCSAEGGKSAPSAKSSRSGMLFYLTQITWMTQIFGALARLGAGAVFVLLLRKKSNKILFKS